MQWLGHQSPWRVLFVAAFHVALAACTQGSEAADYSDVFHFDTTRIVIVTAQDSVPLLVEVANTPELRTQGLMERTSLADSAGMLFVYPADQPATAGFWMYRTRIPLDIAFMDSAGTIVAARQMQPCAARLAAGCPNHEPGRPYRAAVEVNAGFLQRVRIGIGARVLLPAVSAR